MTNAITADAATRQAPPTSEDITLLGVFASPDQSRALIHTRSGDVLMLMTGETQNGLTLMETGDGWALLRQDNQIHRLVIA